MKINHFPPIIVAFCFVTLLYTPVLAQQFENTFGSLANHEEPQDGKPIPNSQYIVLSNSLSYGPASRIVLTRLNSTGSVALFATINELGSPTTAYYGNSIDLELVLKASGARDSVMKLVNEDPLTPQDELAFGRLNSWCVQMWYEPMVMLITRPQLDPSAKALLRRR